MKVNPRKQPSCSVICPYCVTSMRSQSEINMLIATLILVMDDLGGVCLSPAAEAKAEAQPSAVM